MTISVSAGTVSTDHLEMSYLCAICSICSKKHLREVAHRGQILHPGCQSTILRISVGLCIAGVVWGESSGQSKSPTRSDPVLVSQVLCCEDG